MNVCCVCVAYFQYSILSPQFVSVHCICAITILLLLSLIIRRDKWGKRNMRVWNWNTQWRHTTIIEREYREMHFIEFYMFNICTFSFPWPIFKWAPHITATQNERMNNEQTQRKKMNKNIAKIVYCWFSIFTVYEMLIRLFNQCTKHGIF